MVGELLDHVRFGESFFNVAALIRPGGVRKVLGRIRMPDEVSVSMPQIGRIRSHAVLQRRSEWQNFVLDLDRVGGILCEILGLRHHDGDGFTLQIEFARQGLG